VRNRKLHTPLIRHYTLHYRHKIVQARFKIVQELNALSVIVYVRISMTQWPLMGHGLLITEASMSFSSSSVALQPGVGFGLLYNTPPGLSIPCSVSSFVYPHLSQVRGHVIQPSHFWSSSSSCCIQLPFYVPTSGRNY